MPGATCAARSWHAQRARGLHSTNDKIRAAIDDGNSDPVITDLGDFRSACKAAGYRFG